MGFHDGIDAPKPQEAFLAGEAVSLFCRRSNCVTDHRSLEGPQSADVVDALEAPRRSSSSLSIFSAASRSHAYWLGLGLGPGLGLGLGSGSRQGLGQGLGLAPRSHDCDTGPSVTPAAPPLSTR